MFSLIHAAESFDDESYIEGFLSVLIKLREKSPRWTSIVLMRVMNNEGTKDILVRKMREADADVKNSMIWLCQNINQRSPLLLGKTLPVILAAKN